MKLVKYQPRGFNHVICKPEDVVEYIKMLEAEETAVIRIVEMSKEDYEKLPEFRGF